MLFWVFLGLFGDGVDILVGDLDGGGGMGVFIGDVVSVFRVSLL